ncbi:hypothetical protein PQX77_006895 [Marasmius sp. AFHP31]|nr:hypothetical protein PQX77_006895 [Marasmius sp. AFHP31]
MAEDDPRNNSLVPATGNIENQEPIPIPPPIPSPHAPMPIRAATNTYIGNITLIPNNSAALSGIERSTVIAIKTESPINFTDLEHPVNLKFVPEESSSEHEDRWENGSDSGWSYGGEDCHGDNGLDYDWDKSNDRGDWQHNYE